MEATTPAPPTPAPVTGRLIHIKLKDIEIDPDQPRKTYDEKSMQELIESVTEKGIIQPIAVQENLRKGKPYIIIAGGRRYKAATAVQTAIKDRDTIPAIVYPGNLVEHEIRQLQLIENLQREDVHPQQEAIGFKQLLAGKHTVEQIAAKVGKSVYFVRQRLKLNSLSKDWQKVYIEGKITHEDALRLAALSENSQRHLYAQKAHNHNLKWNIGKVTNELKNAPFDIKDETLNPKMGSCLTCPFNSACNSLFPGDAKNPICNNLECWDKKASVSFDRQLKDITENHTDAILINSQQYYRDNWKEDEKFVKRIIAAGHKVYSADELSIKGNYDYERTRGVEIEGLMVSGDNKGKIVKCKIPSKGSAGKVNDKKKQGKLTKSDIESEVKRINERRRRNKEIDINTIHRETLQQLQKVKSKVVTMPHQGAVDRGIMVYFLLHEITDEKGYGRNRSETPGLPHSPSGFGYQEDYIMQLAKVSDNKLAELIRRHAIKKIGDPQVSREVNTDDTVMRLIARYAGVDIKAIEKAQAEKTAKREARASQRIASLKKSLDKKPKEAAEKKPKQKK